MTAEEIPCRLNKDRRHDEKLDVDFCDYPGECKYKIKGQITSGYLCNYVRGIIEEVLERE